MTKMGSLSSGECNSKFFDLEESKHDTPRRGAPMSLQCTARKPNKRSTACTDAGALTTILGRPVLESAQENLLPPPKSAVLLSGASSTHNSMTPELAWRHTNVLAAHKPVLIHVCV